MLAYRTSATPRSAQLEMLEHNLARHWQSLVLADRAGADEGTLQQLFVDYMGTLEEIVALNSPRPAPQREKRKPRRKQA
jgi:hypothetical protein